MVINEKRIRKGVFRKLKINMGVEEDEKILILTDFPEYDKVREIEESELMDIVERTLLARRVKEIVEEKYSDVKLVIFPCTLKHGTEPPDWLFESAEGYDVMIALTSYSLSHTRFRKEFTKRGVRIASMPGFIQRMFYEDGAMSANYYNIKEESEELAEILTKGEIVRIKTKLGTNLTLDIKNRECEPDTGIFVEEGDWGNLPSGEAMMAPLNANGTIIVPEGWFKNLNSNMTMRFEEGEVKEIKGGGAVGDKFRKLLAEEGEEHRKRIAELGVGVNEKANNPLNVLEAEKIKGTVHVAIGDNTSFPGGENESDIHQDFILPDPTMTVDGKLIIEEGEWKI